MPLLSYAAHNEILTFDGSNDANTDLSALFVLDGDMVSGDGGHGEEVVITYQVRITDDAAGALDFFGYYSCNNVTVNGTDDANTAVYNDDDQWCVVIYGGDDNDTNNTLNNAGIVRKEASQYHVEPGSEVVFMIEVWNPTPLTLHNVNVTDELPIGFEYVANTGQVNGNPDEPDSVTPSPYNPPNDVEQTLVWNLGDIDGYGHKYITFTTHVRCNVSNGTFTNYAEVRAETGDGTYL